MDYGGISVTTGKGVVLTSGGGREEELGKEELWGLERGFGGGTGLLGGKKVGERVAVEGGVGYLPAG